MKGYVRRKVTRNLGKGIGVKGPKDPTAHNGEGAVTANPWTWFNAPIESPPEKHLIIDHTGEHEVDSDYAAEGVREGWLILTSGRVLNGHMVNHYCHIYK